MPSLHVPNELLETIFDLVHDKTAEPTPESQQTFASLARTAKVFLPLARSYLYYRPISPSSPVSWTKAISLAASISSPIGKLVVSLEGIADFVFDLETLDKPVVDLPFKLSGYSPVFSFYYTITQSSLHLVTVEIVAHSMRLLNKFLKVLGGKESTLKTVKLGSTSRDWYGISFIQVVAALGSAQLGDIENLVLEDVDTIDCLDVGEPSIPFQAKSFSLISKIRHRRLSHLKMLFPKDPSSLEKVSIEITDTPLGCYEWILRYLPLTLAEISFTGYRSDEHGDPSGASLGDYWNSRLCTLFGLDLSRFNSLVTLSLHDFHGSSLDLVESLATSAPLLSRVDFKGCRWTRNSARLTTRSNVAIIVDLNASSSATTSGIVDLDDLKAVLLKMRKLKKIHLGLLPTEKRETYESLGELRETNGIKVEWDNCES